MRKIPGPAGDSSGLQAIASNRFGDKKQQYKLFACFAFTKICKIFDICADEITVDDEKNLTCIDSWLKLLVEKIHEVPITCIGDLTNFKSFIVPCMLLVIAKVSYTSDSSWILNLIDPSSYVDGINGYMTSDVASIHDGLRVVRYNFYYHIYYLHLSPSIIGWIMYSITQCKSLSMQTICQVLFKY